MFYVLKSSDVLDVLVPILYQLNDARADPCKSYTHSVTQQTMNVLSMFMFYVLLIFNHSF